MNFEQEKANNIVPKSHYLVTKANDLVEAKQEHPLSRNELKLVLILISMIQPKDEDFKEYSISVRDYANLLGMSDNSQSVYSTMKKTMDDLMTKTVILPSDTEPTGYAKTHWVATCIYVPGAALRLKLTPDLKPYLLHLQKSYTQYQLTHVLSLTSAYSILLYEFMKRWEYQKGCVVSVEELRLTLGATKKTFQRYHEFKVKIIDRAIDEINEKTDIHISCREIKKGQRKVDALEFSIKHTIREEDIALGEVVATSEDNDNVSRIRRDLYDALYKQLNEQLKKYKVPQDTFFQWIDYCMFIWMMDEAEMKERIQRELTNICVYADTEDSILIPIAFVESKLQKSLEFAKEGIDVSFESLNQRERKPKLPDWFEKYHNKDQDIGQPTDVLKQEEAENDFEIYRAALQKKLNNEPLSEQEEVLLAALYK